METHIKGSGNRWHAPRISIEPKDRKGQLSTKDPFLCSMFVWQSVFKGPNKELCSPTTRDYKGETFNKDQTRKPRQFKVLPLA